MTNSILNHIEKIPQRYSKGSYKDSTFGITKTIFNNGNSFKIYGE